MIAYMRNVQTGEVKEVELDSDEMRELQAEVYDHGDGRAYPSWEQTGDHAVRRVDSGDVNVDADLGYEDKTVGTPNMSTEGLQADPHPERTLTQAEQEAGVGSFEEKLRNNGHQVPTRDAEAVDRGLGRVGRQGDGGGRGPTKKELKAEADDLGIEGTGSMNKAELQSAIDEHHAGATV